MSFVRTHANRYDLEKCACAIVKQFKTKKFLSKK